jgi:xanthosine utilization system XapX-like protein
MAANLLPAAIGFLLFAVFVGFLAIRIAAPPMLIIVGLVLVLCLYDFVQTLRED